MMVGVVYIDDCQFVEAQYQPGNELYLVNINGPDVLVFGVSEETFLALQRDPSAESIASILRSHRWSYA